MKDFVIPEPKVKPAPIDNTGLVTEFRSRGGMIVHVLPTQYHRGVTFAFIAHKPSRVEMASAVQHRADVFTKKQGTKNAIEHFNAGKTIVLPLRSCIRPSDVLKTLTYYL